MNHLVRVSIGMALILAAVVAAQIGSAAPVDDSAFRRTWERTDQPVKDGAVSRTWMWGPVVSGLVQEDYAQSPGGHRVVWYFDKSRMEITHPGGDVSNTWYVTNGLLSKELITGQLQTGDDTFITKTPAEIPVAGDRDDTTGPTYATFLDLLGAAPIGDGAPVIQSVFPWGEVTNDPALTAYGVTAAHHVVAPGIDHQVASPFWEFMNSTGTVWENGQLTNALLFENPFYATGYPITEAYWSKVTVGGSAQLVLIQCFERRCLTYTPENPEGWKVEAGNAGQHYYAWRYPGGISTPAPTVGLTATYAMTPTVGVVITPGGDDAIELLDIGFGQAEDSDEVGYGFVVRNISGDTLDYSEYEIVAYDDAGEPLERDFGFIDLLLPGETRGIGGSIYVPEGTVPAKVEVQITSGDPTTSDFPQPFTASNATYFDADFFPIVTAVIASPYDQPVEDVDIHVLLYNSAGDIIGGGYDYVDFVLPGQPTGAEVYVAGSAAPDHIEVYAVVSSLTVLTETTGQQPGVVQSGWGMSPNGFDAGYGALVENPNGGQIVDCLRYQAIAYNAEGQVLTIDSSYISGLFASERFGIGGSVYPPEGTTIDRIEFQVLASGFIDSTMANLLSVSDVAFVGDEFSASVTGTVSSSLDIELNNVETHAIAYNAAGEIIGGGWGFTDDVLPPGGSVPAEVLSSVSEIPATVELYATPASLQDVLP